jgi:hypothetical protein
MYFTNRVAIVIGCRCKKNDIVRDSFLFSLTSTSGLQDAVDEEGPVHNLCTPYFTS